MKRNMRNFAMLAILAVVGFSTIAAADWGGGSGHMMGPMMGSGWNHGNGYYGDLTAEQISKLDQRRLEFFKATEGLRRQLYDKEVALQAELTKENPDNGKASQLQSEVSKLRSDLDQKGLEFEIQAKKIAPKFNRGHMGYGPYGGGNCMW